MNKSIIYGLVVCLLVLVGLVYWFMQTVPFGSDVDAITTRIDKVDSNILASNSFKKIKSLDKNGNIPVDLTGKSLGKNNPFE